MSTAAPILACGLLAIAITGCGKTEEPAGGPLEITFWHTQSSKNADVLKEIISNFNRENSDVKITAQYTGGYTDLYRKMRASVSGGNMPDLAVAYESMVAEYASAGVVEPLDGYVRHGEYALSDEEVEDIFPGYLETNRFEEFSGKLLSFPFTKSNLMMYYNLDMIKKAGFKDRPTTWEEFLVQCPGY